MPKRLEVYRLAPYFREAVRIVDDEKVPRAPQQHVVVKNRFVGINAADVLVTKEYYEGHIPTPRYGCGFEGEVGEGVQGMRVGDAVVCVMLTKLGAFAEYTVVPADWLVRCDATEPGILPLMVSGASASLALEAIGDLKANETVLVTAAAGGAGQFAVQLAKRAGNHVIGACSSDKKAAYLTQLGCDRVVNYRNESLFDVLENEYPNGVDLAFESVGGEMLVAAVENLALFGRVIVFGQISTYERGYVPEPIDGERFVKVLMAKSASLRGFSVLNDQPTQYMDQLHKLLQLVNNKHLVAGVDVHIFQGLESIADAVEYMYARKNMGKIVVEIAAE